MIDVEGVWNMMGIAWNELFLLEFNIIPLKCILVVLKKNIYIYIYI